MQKGFSLPIIVFLVFFLLLLPLTFWLSSNSVNFSIANNVKGVSDYSGASKEGLHFKLISNSGSWDLLQYVCSTKEECLSSTTSGKRTSSVSGGKTSLQEIVVAKNSDWSNYSYLKVFVKPGWGSSDRHFKAVLITNDSFYETVNFTEAGYNYQAVLIDLSKAESLKSVATFSDK